MPQLQCEEIRFPSADGVHTVAASMYTMPGAPVRAVLQLSHGMCEYVQRYRPMAQWYAQRGIALAGNDHLGHGATSPKSNTGEAAIDRALADVRAGRSGPIPRQLQNKHYDGADAAVKGQHYQYAHDFANHWVDQQYLPDAIRDRQYYQFGDNKNEQAAAAYWQRIKGDKFKK